MKNDLSFVKRSHSPQEEAGPLTDLPFTFRALVKQEESRVTEALQLGGDFPQCTNDNAISQDWQHILVEATGALFEQLRFDESDPVVIRVMRLKLAQIAAICEAWDKSIMGEEAK